MLFKRADKNEWYVKIPVPGGRWKPRSTGTARTPSAQRIEEAVKLLHPKLDNRLDELLAAVNDGRVALKELGKDPTIKALRALQTKLRDKELDDEMEEWHAIVARKSTRDTANHYRNAVKSFKRSLNPHPPKEGQKTRPFRAETLTLLELQKWMDNLGGEHNTRRKYAAGLASFCQHLVRRGLLDHNPMREIDLPPLGPSRDYHLETEEAEALVKEQDGDYRALAALMAGSGIEISVALSLTARDVYAGIREVRARGTKTHSRDRIIRVADWAWPYFYEAVSGKDPDEKIFKSIPNRWNARNVHAEACDALVGRGLTRYNGYTMRDHRHTYAVRAIKAGTPVPVVASQLGHSNGVLVLKVYGKHIPDEADRAHWESIATAMDKARKDKRKRGFGVFRGVSKGKPKKDKAP